MISHWPFVRARNFARALLLRTPTGGWRYNSALRALAARAAITYDSLLLTHPLNYILILKGQTSPNITSTYGIPVGVDHFDLLRLLPIHILAYGMRVVSTPARLWLELLSVRPLRITRATANKHTAQHTQLTHNSHTTHTQLTHNSHNATQRNAG